MHNEPSRSHARVWNYIKYLRKKPDSCVKEAYKIDSDLDTKNSHFKDVELGIKQLIVANVNKNQDPYNVAKKRVNFFLKNDYVQLWKEKNPKLPNVHIVCNTQN